MSSFSPLLATTGRPVWLSPHRANAARTAFAGSIDVHPVLVKDTMYKLPFSVIPQVAFVGRSNVGKSSLINALLHGREVARPSPMPGRTRQLFTFDVGNAISLVDLPGYGFAGKIDRRDREEWLEMMKAYMARANALERIVSLIDCRHGVKQIDEEFWMTIIDSPIHAKRKHKAQVVVTLTKTDLVDQAQLEKTVRATTALVEHYSKSEKLPVWPYIHSVSAEKGFGINELRAALFSVCPIQGPHTRIVLRYVRYALLVYDISQPRIPPPIITKSWEQHRSLHSLRLRVFVRGGLSLEVPLDCGPAVRGR